MLAPPPFISQPPLPDPRLTATPCFYSIEGNFVLIGACIPTLLPLIRKIFGQSVLGGSTPPKDSNRKQRCRQIRLQINYFNQLNPIQFNSKQVSDQSNQI